MATMQTESPDLERASKRLGMPPYREMKERIIRASICQATS